MIEKQKTVLYVDDDHPSILLIKQQLKGLDINLITEYNGYDALKSFATHKDNISLVILDVHMPELNGYDILLSIRSENKTVPIIMVTATSFVDNRDVILSLGATEYLVKPITHEYMIELVNKYIN